MISTDKASDIAGAVGVLAVLALVVFGHRALCSPTPWLLFTSAAFASAVAGIHWCRATEPGGVSRAATIMWALAALVALASLIHPADEVATACGLR